MGSKFPIIMRENNSNHWNSSTLFEDFKILNQIGWILQKIVQQLEQLGKMGWNFPRLITEYVLTVRNFSWFIWKLWHFETNLAESCQNCPNSKTARASQMAKTFPDWLLNMYWINWNFPDHFEEFVFWMKFGRILQNCPAFKTAKQNGLEICHIYHWRCI